MALGPYASAEEKRLFNIEEKLDRILAIVLRKTPEDYTRIAREEAEKVFGYSDGPAPSLDFTLDVAKTAQDLNDIVGWASTEPLIVPAVVDNSERPEIAYDPNERFDTDELPF